MPSLFGGGDSGAGAATQAAQIQSDAALRAAQIEQQMYEQARQDVAPWRQLGGATTGVLGGLYNIPGYAAQDPTKTLQATPGYQWLQGQGVQALDRSAAAKGMLMSGPQQKALTNYGQNLAQTYAWNPYVNQLNTMSGQGLQAGTTSGQFGMQAGNVIGQDYMQAGQAQAQGVWNAYLANQAMQQQQNQMWGSLAGMGLGSLAGIPFGGGGFAGLGSLFGGGGGGAAADLSGNYMSMYGSNPFWSQ